MFAEDSLKRSKPSHPSIMLRAMESGVLDHALELLEKEE
jgi:hypothetical protein